MKAPDAFLRVRNKFSDLKTTPPPSRAPIGKDFMMHLLETSFLAEQEVSEGDNFNSEPNCSRVGPVEMRI